MSIDPATFEEFLTMPDIATRDALDIHGVEVALPMTAARGKSIWLDWQRRVLNDLMPDSINADAPERTPFRLLYALTTGIATQRTMDDVLSGELAPLDDIFRVQTKGKNKIPLAFHVLAVKSASRGQTSSRGFSERTLLLLLRDEAGVVDSALAQRLVQALRRNPDELDFAQRTLLEQLQPGWTTDDEPSFALPDSARLRVVPFDQSAAQLFQADVRTLLDAELPPADFFHQLNLLLILHLGLYQPRLAALLNPQMSILFDDMASPDEANIRKLQAIESRAKETHPFRGSLMCRAPDTGLRSVTLQTPERQSLVQLTNELAKLHFNLLCLLRIRALTKAYLRTQWGWTGQPSADQLVDLDVATQRPSALLRRLHDDEGFRAFLERALTAFGIRFVFHQLAEPEHASAFARLRAADSGLDGLRSMYELYNNQSSKNKTSSRAYRQGISITTTLLGRNQYGLIQGRRRVGPFFELGAGILPLLLLLVIGAGREKVPVRTLWEQLSNYGLTFSEEERERLLSRLQAMGVYERYSDAGEAAYVRNLMMSTRQGA